MRKRTAQLLLVTLFTASTSLTCRAQSQNKEAVLVLTHANLIDGVSPEVLRDATIVLRGSRIESVGRNAAAPSGATVVDLKGRWLMPGFVDAHAHLNDLEAARRALQYGSTTLRVLGVEHFIDVGMRELHNSGWTDLPAIVAAGYPIRPDLGAAMSGFLLDFPNLNRLVSGLRGADDLRTVVRVLAEHHVDLIKILATERALPPEMDPRKRTFTDQEMSAIVDEARKAGLNVAAHAHGDEGARGAVLAGVHSIEHGTYLTDETLTLMKAKGTYFVPTIATWVDDNDDNPAFHRQARAMQPRSRDSAARAWKMGVKIVAGTDLTYAPTGVGHSMADEIAELVRIGMPPMDAIKAGTSVSAECLGIEKRVGTIKPGMTADFVAVDQDPLANIEALQDLVLVIHDGKVIVSHLTP